MRQRSHIVAEARGTRLIRGAGNNRAVSTATASSFLNTAGKVGRVTISERIEAARRERRVLARVSRAAWRLEQAERERTWALASARAEGISIRTLATAAELSPSRGAGNNGLVSTAKASSFLNAAGTMGRVTISERIEAARRERRVLTRVSRAAWRLEQAERERTWALVSARAEGVSIRTLATAIGLSPSRVHQIVADADLDALDAALGELRAAGWPAPEHPDSGEDTELGGLDSIADRLSDEVSWPRQCAGWVRQLDGGGYPPAVSLRPAAGWPDRAVVA